ncbi:MAG: hypothetical protein DDT33_01560 [Firmicutes bacterium]|nr:hypothetical protein [Bacillota bacterium]
MKPIYDSVEPTEDSFDVKELPKYVNRRLIDMTAGIVANPHR